ncbi:MAG: GNAT family N-acetyltransferase [Clostridia bacterium]|nr:GNAT family N-acetyltransferase [Clostridia bacterium]
MKIKKIINKTEHIIDTLLGIWENSVRSTHKFLTDAEIENIKKYVPSALYSVDELYTAESDDGQITGFMGINSNRLEMLFVSSTNIGRGYGKLLLLYGIKNCGVNELTVNEQNPDAVGFYRYMGFEVYKRTDTDEEGNLYPLLYMKRKLQ